MKLASISVLCLFVAHAPLAFAGSVSDIKVPKESSVVTLGSEKPAPTLKLGALRTGEAALPGSRLTPKERAVLRHRRAAARHVVRKRVGARLILKRAVVRKRLAVRAKRVAARHARAKR